MQSITMGFVENKHCNMFFAATERFVFARWPVHDSDQYHPKMINTDNSMVLSNETNLQLTWNRTEPQVHKTQMVSESLKTDDMFDW